ncbi:MAG: FprA family A-type flavoprotein [Desulfobacteraceae bacterium]|jgi:flavorubredoxin
MEPIEIAKGIYDVGVNDWNIDDFHGYSTPLGTSYNAYLIVDEKVALIDTVKKKFADQLLANISKIIDPKKIDYVISNHAEMDHSGSLARVMHRIGEDKPIYCSKLGAKNLAKHFPQKWNYIPVKEGQDLSLGSRTLTFIETRMLHWPDNMFTYVKEDKILFSSDAFGQHYAGYEKYNDVLGDSVMLHAQKYYANILMLYAPHTLKLMDKVTGLGLEFDMICPDHGLIWRKDPAQIINAYVEWSKQTAKRKAVVVYDTMWHSTEKMADAVASGLNSEGISVRPMYLRKWHRSDIMTDVLDAQAVVIGSPTLNNNLFPTISDFLCYLQGLKPLNKIGAAFGSYGWSGEAPKMITRALEDMKFDIIEPVRHQYIPDRSALEASYELGKAVGRAINDRITP